MPQPPSRINSVLAFEQAPVMVFGVFILAFAFFASVALGAATAWGLYAYTHRRWVWLLTPLFAIVWFLLGTTPFLLLAWETTRTPAPLIAPAPPAVPPITQPDHETPVIDAPKDSP
jgi:hypothetical protein